MIDPVLTRKKAAEVLSISMRTLERLESRGILTGRVRLSQRRFGYPESVISAYISRLGWEAHGKQRADV